MNRLCRRAPRSSPVIASLLLDNVDAACGFEESGCAMIPQLAICIVHYLQLGELSTMLHLLARSNVFSCSNFAMCEASWFSVLY